MARTQRRAGAKIETKLKLTEVLLQMGANVPIKVKVLRLVEETVEIYAVTLDAAKDEARTMPGVAHVLEATYVFDDDPWEQL